MNKPLKALKPWTRALVAAWGLVGLATWVAPVDAMAQEAARAAPAVTASSLGELPAWPSEDEVRQALARSPLWQAAQERRRAEQARAGASAANPNDWTPSASWARRQARNDAAVPGATGAPSDVSTREWSLGLSRGVRLPAKAEAARLWGEGQQARAEAQLSLAWRELTRQWLDDATAALQASQQMQLAQAQLALLTQQQQATSRRHALGDAARQEVVLLDAARAQLQAQQVSAQLRLQAAQGLWRSRYPGLALPQWPQDATLLPASEGGATPALVVDDALLERHPQVRQARLEAEALEAQARFASAERQPDPTVGVQMGRERSGAERILGVNVSWPIGSQARSLQAQAQWADAQAARANETEVRRQVQQNLQQWSTEVALSQQAWQAADQALAHTRQAAQAVRKGYELGEGNLSEVLLLQRQWLDQQQTTAQLALEALRARWRWAMESDGRWGWVPSGATLP